MVYILVYSWLTTYPLDAHVRVIAAFERKEHCEIMREEVTHKNDHYSCIASSLEYKPMLSEIENFHLLAKDNRHLTLPVPK